MMVSFMKTFWANESGASAAEYALILAIIGTGIAVASVALGTAISNAMTTSATCISTPTASNCS